MRITIIISIITLRLHSLIAQDAIIKIDGDTINAIVTEQTADHISYKFPNEQLSNSIHQKFLSKIILASGREITINRPDQIKLVYGMPMFSEIRVANSIDDVRDLQKISDLVTRRKGKASSVEQARFRFLRKASMLGASYVVITNEKLFYDYAEVSGTCYNHYTHKENEIKDFIQNETLTLIYANSISEFAVLNSSSNSNQAKNEIYIFKDDGNLIINGELKGKYRITDNMLHIEKNWVNKRGKVKTSTFDLKASFVTQDLMVLYDNGGNNQLIITYAFKN